MTPPRPSPDPLRSFRAVMVATLLLEGIVVLLALPVVAKLGDGLTTWQGVLVGGLALAMFLACAVAGRPWGIGVATGLQVIMVACWVVVPALGILGLAFGLVWMLLLWMRRDVARRMAEGRLPGQQSTSPDHTP